MPVRDDLTADAVRRAALRAAGLRVTATRTAVLGAVAPGSHVGADEVYERVRGILPGTSRQSVHNALGDFVAAGLLRRIEPAGHPRRYEVRVDDNHHHLVCSRCGRIDDVDCVVGHAPCLTPDDALGYRVDVAEVIFWGECADCAARP